MIGRIWLFNGHVLPIVRVLKRALMGQTRAVVVIAARRASEQGLKSSTRRPN